MDSRTQRCHGTQKEPGGELRRRLGLLDAVAIYVGIIVGSGIFFAPADVAAAAPGLGAALGLWVLGAAVAACGALCYAECGARLPHTGGFFVYLRVAFGDGVAFVAGWCAFLITYPASIAAIAHVFAAYLAEVAPATSSYPVATAAAPVLLSGALNLVGVRTSAWSQRLLTLVKVLAMAVLCGAALAYGHAPSAPSHDLATLTSKLPLLLGAIVVILWTYDGWSSVTLVAGELRRPGRDLGLTVGLGTGAVLTLYVLVQLAVGALLPPASAAASTRVFADAVRNALGGSALVALLVVLSTSGSIHGTLLTASRLGFAMALAHVTPRWMARIHPRWQTPSHSLAALVFVTLIYVSVGSFRDLLALFSFSVWLFYGLVAVALLVLRKRKVGMAASKPPWQAPLGWLPPAIVLATGAAMTVGLALSDPYHSLVGAALLLAGAGVYAFWARKIHDRASGLG